jgi:hypothetical protein
MQYYQRFLNLVLRSQILRTSKFLCSFLQDSNQEAFNQSLLSVREERGPRCIFDLKTITGEIEVEKR